MAKKAAPGSKAAKAKTTKKPVKPENAGSFVEDTSSGGHGKPLFKK